MKVKVLRGVWLNGKACRPGDVVEIPDSVAANLLNRRAVEPVTEARETATAPKTKAKTTRKRKPKASDS